MLPTRQNCNPSTSYNEAPTAPAFRSKFCSRHARNSTRQQAHAKQIASSLRSGEFGVKGLLWNNDVEARSRSIICHGRRKTDKVAEEPMPVVENQMRPWTLKIPTFYEVLNDKNWPEKVEDWLMFWGMFQNWQWAHEHIVKNEGEISPVALEQMWWLQLSDDVIHYQPQLLEAVIDIVVKQVPFLISAGVPVPESIRGKMPWHSGIYDLVRGADADGNAYIEQGEIKGVKPLFEAPKPKRSAIFEYGEGSMARPWDDWDEWDFRVFMEKKKRHRQDRARFAKKQAEVGSKKYLVVSHLTDSRLAAETPFYEIDYREHTHEECMDIVTGGGKYADPRFVPVKIRDPDVYADAFAEGAHYVPDVIDYCRSIGRLAESEQELIGENDDTSGAMLEEDFADMDGSLSAVEGDDDPTETMTQVADESEGGIEGEGSIEGEGGMEGDDL